MLSNELGRSPAGRLPRRTFLVWACAAFVTPCRSRLPLRGPPVNLHGQQDRIEVSTLPQVRSKKAKPCGFPVIHEDSVPGGQDTFRVLSVKSALCLVSKVLAVGESYGEHGRYSQVFVDCAGASMGDRRANRVNARVADTSATLGNGVAPSPESEARARSLRRDVDMLGIARVQSHCRWKSIGDGVQAVSPRRLAFLVRAHGEPYRSAVRQWFDKEVPPRTERGVRWCRALVVELGAKSERSRGWFR